MSSLSNFENWKSNFVTNAALKYTDMPGKIHPDDQEDCLIPLYNNSDIDAEVESLLEDLLYATGDEEKMRISKNIAEYDMYKIGNIDDQYDWYPLKFIACDWYNLTLYCNVNTVGNQWGNFYLCRDDNRSGTIVLTRICKKEAMQIYISFTDE